MTNHDETKGAGDTELLHRYVDGDLSPAERDALERRAASDATIRARIEGLLEIRALIAEAASKASDDLDANALFSRIEGSLDSLASSEGDAVVDPPSERKRPDLRVLPGGQRAGDQRAGGERTGASERPAAPAVPADVRRRRLIGAVIGALAVAAAAAIAFTSQSDDPEIAAEDPVPENVVPEPPALPESELASADANRTEVLEVDFGTNVGTIFAVEGDEGQRYAVVWLDDAGEVSASD